MCYRIGSGLVTVSWAFDTGDRSRTALAFLSAAATELLNHTLFFPLLMIGQAAALLVSLLVSSQCAAKDPRHTRWNDQITRSYKQITRACPANAHTHTRRASNYPHKSFGGSSFSFICQTKRILVLTYSSPFSFHAITKLWQILFHHFYVSHWIPATPGFCFRLVHAHTL